MGMPLPVGGLGLSPICVLFKMNACLIVLRNFITHALIAAVIIENNN